MSEKPTREEAIEAALKALQAAPAAAQEQDSDGDGKPDPAVIHLDGSVDGARIKEAREAAGRTLDQLPQSIPFLDRSFVEELEAGKADNHAWAKAAAVSLAGWLDVAPETFQRPGGCVLLTYLHPLADSEDELNAAIGVPAFITEGELPRWSL